MWTPGKGQIRRCQNKLCIAPLLHIAADQPAQEGQQGLPELSRACLSDVTVELTRAKIKPYRETTAVYAPGKVTQTTGNGQQIECDAARGPAGQVQSARYPCNQVQVTVRAR